MTNLSLTTAVNPVRELCDYFHIYPAWVHRLENVQSTGNTITSCDLVKTEGSVNKVIHISHIDGLGLVISNTEECLNIQF